MIFQNFGPHIDEALDPESNAAERWKRKVLSRIIPNNRRVLAFLDANLHLLMDREIDTLEDFRQHIDDLEARHLEGIHDGGSRFPEQMETIVKD